MYLSFVVLFDMIIRSFMRYRTKIGLSGADSEADFFLHIYNIYLTDFSIIYDFQKKEYKIGICSFFLNWSGFDPIY